jgi:tetratricopeptide (TPR) repeat protein
VYGYGLHEWHAAERALRENRLEEARRRLEVCRRLWPRSVRVHLLLARAARLSGEVRQAEALLNQCLKLEKGPQDDIQLEFLLLRVQMGEEDEVAHSLLNCVEHHHPETLLILETLTQAYLRNLRLGPALNCLNRWVQEAPDTAKPYQLRGWVLERLNNHTAALKDYHRALDLEPGLLPVRLRLVEILLEKANVDGALAHLDKLREQAPERPEVQARLGQLRLLQGQRAEARRLLEGAEPHLPQDVLLLIDLGKLELQEGRPEKAEAYFRRALRVDPTDT